MKRTLRRLLLSPLLLTLACAGEADRSSEAGDDQAALEALRAFVPPFLERPEHGAERVVVRHLLVTFAGAPGAATSRSREDAELRAARLFAQAREGADFGALIAKYTDDSPDGRYTMVAGGEALRGAFRRDQMVPAFGQAGWRLEVGEIGAVAHDPETSPFGWHLVERLE